MARHLRAETMREAVDYIHALYPDTRDCVVKYDMDAYTDNGFTEYDCILLPGAIGYNLLGALYVYIGMKTFNAKIENGMACDEDCVWLAFPALHEGALQMLCKKCNGMTSDR